MSKDVRAGKAFWELGVKDKLDAGLKAASAKLKSYSASLTAAGVGLAAAGGLITAPLTFAVNAFTTAGAAVDDMSKRTGMSAAAITELTYAAQQSGTDIGTVEGAVNKMAKAIDEAAHGSESAKEALKRLGLSADQLGQMTPDQQLAAMADGLAKIENPTEKAAAAMAVFGKSGTQLLPLMADGAAGLAEMRARAKELGLSMSDEAAGSAAALDDGLAAMKATVSGLYNAIGSALAPTITDLAARATDYIAQLSGWIANHKALILTVGKIAAGLTAAGAAMTGLGAAGLALSKLLPYARILGPLLAAVTSPIGLVAAGIGAAAFAFFKFTNVGKDAWRILSLGAAALYETIRPTIDAIKTLLAAGDYIGAAETAADAFANLWKNTIDTLAPYFAAAWDSILAIAQPVIDALAAAWTTLTGWILDLWAMIPEGIRAYLGSAVDQAFGAITAIGDLFANLGKIAGDTIGGIADAMAGGNWALAGQIAMAGLKAAWLTGMAAIEKPWLEFTTGLFNAFDSAITAVRTAWTSASSWIAEKLLALFGYLQQAAASVGIELMPSFDAEAAIQMLREDSARTKASLEAANAERNSARAAELSAELAATERQLAELDAQRQELNRQAAEDAATAAAATTSATPAGRPAIPATTPNKLAAPQFQDMALEAAKTAPATGTFSAAAALMIAGPNDAAGRTAAATEKTAKHTEAIAKQTRTAAVWKP